MSNTLTVTLAGLVEVKFPIQSFFVNTFFKEVVLSDTKEIAIDKVLHGEQLARFVACCVESKARANPTLSTKYFEPAYLKEKTNLLDCDKLNKRCPGEPINGAWSRDMRFAYWASYAQMQHQEMFQRRFEWMAAQTLAYAKYTVSGEGVPTYVVDFGRNAANTFVPALAWTSPLSTPVKDIQAMTRLVLDGGGFPADILVLGADVYDAIVAHHDVNDIIVNNGFTASKLLNTELAVAIRGAEYKGRWGGANGIEVWMYSDKYRDEAGILQDMFPPDGVVVASTKGMYGKRAYGGINVLGQFGAVEMYGYQYNSPDLQSVFHETLSNALMIAGNPDATVFATAV